MWRRVKNNGYIYKKNYQTKYCVGCELEKTDSELVDGKCPIHPNKEIELRDEENYFFALSKLSDDLKKLYAAKPGLVIPEFRFNEMKAFLERGLQDFSISRPAAKMSWGVPVPDDAEHVMYVWFDALTNYISTLGWPEDAEGNYKKFWEEGLKIQYCGKDNVRQQSMMWQAILLAAKLPNTDTIVINGFINSGGQKMSKSLGNVINPYDLIKDYEVVAGDLASDVLRYYLLRHVNPFEDSDMTLETVKEAYQAGLANGLGNLVSRIMTLSERNLDNRVVELIVEDEDKRPSLLSDFKVEQFRFDTICEMIWNSINKLDKSISEEEPFKIIKVDQEKGKKMLIDYVSKLAQIAYGLKPLLPKTSEKLLKIIKENKKPVTPLFLRKD
jgi:methionyl-tRNA synthetase